MESNTLRLRSQLSMHALKMSVRLGWGDAERATPQEVLVDIDVLFARLPVASTTDELSGTLCYDDLTQSIRAICAARPYKLIEHLGHEIFRAVRGSVGEDNRVRVRLTKLRTPIAELTGGASFTCDDFTA